MELAEGKSAYNPDGEMKEIFSEFMTEVVKLEEFGTVGRRFLCCFQQALEFLRRPSINETSGLVQSIIKANETKRVQSYVQAGCVNVHDNVQNLTKLSTSLSGLQDHLSSAKSIFDKLKNLMEKAGNAVQATTKSENSADWLVIDSSEVPDHKILVSNMEEIGSCSPDNFGGANCATFMAIIYNMLKQDYVMQERIVSSLGLKSSTGELDSYCQMWSLRPYVNDDVIHEALRLVT